MSQRVKKGIRHRARFDLWMLASALAAAVVVVAMGLFFKINEREAQVQNAALDLARQLVVMPAGQANVESLRAGFKQVLDYQSQRRDFAYAGVYTQTGDALAQAYSLSQVSERDVAQDPPSLIGSWVQSAVPEAINGRPLIGFLGPIQLGDSTGYYRVAFFKPDFGIALEELGFLAAATFPVFLLALLGSFFMRLAIGPLRGLNLRLSEQLGDDHVNSAAKPATGSDLATFTAQFDQFMAQAQSRIDRYQKERDSMATSERFLHYRLNRFESILHALPEAVLVLDDAKRVTFVNERARRYLASPGSSADQQDGLLAQPVSACNAISPLKVWAREFEASSGSILPEPLICPMEGHGPLVLTCSVHAVTGDAGAEPTGYLMMLRDSTQESLAAQKRAEFVAHVSHELKSPLNTLGLCVDTLKMPLDQEHDDSEFRLEAVNIIGDEVERLAALIANLLNITQIEMGTMELSRTRVRLADLIEDIFESTKRSSADPTLKFELDLPPKLPAVLVDKDLLRIAVNNLVTNAIKYSNPEGTIRVSISETDDAISISVTDEGIGIAAEDQAAIFNKFYRAEDQVARARGGQGLGLALAQEIVQMHHGSIRVNSVFGEGSTFTIDLWKSADILQQAI